MQDWQSATSSLLAPLTRAERLGIITDFDGTLSAIVPDPAAAHIHPTSRAHLQALQPKLALLALVSGRGAADVQRLANLEGAVVVGNHGMERWHNGEVIVPPQVAQYRPQLALLLAQLAQQLPEGTHIEDKGATASVHYRRADNPTQAAQTLREQLAPLCDAYGITLHEGKMVLELRPPIDTNKGSAFRALVNEFNLSGALYLGDDVTDADALRAAQDLRHTGTCYSVGLGVFHDADMPNSVQLYADVSAEGVEGVAAFLGWLSSALSASST